MTDTAETAADASEGAGRTGPLGCERPLCECYDVALLDLDGVVYVKRDPVPGAADSLAKARGAGMRTAFVTNNASRTPAAVAVLLTEVGVPAVADDVVTSAQAAARLLARRLPAGSAVLVVGGMGLRQAVRNMGLRPVSTAAERPAAVVQGFSAGLSYGLLAEGGKAVAAGALFVASNGDRTVPEGNGPQPGNGALIRVIAAATGTEPIVAGKPEPPLHQEAILRTAARRPLVVGDRLDTDIEGARRGGADSLLVLTGVTDPVALITARPEHRPTYIAADLTGLLEPHPQVRAVRVGGTDGEADAGTDRGAEEEFHCGDWAARRVGDRLELSGRGARIDALRALCAAAWRSRRPVGAGDLPAQFR